MTFDVEEAIDLVAEFCTIRDVHLGTKYSVVPQLDRALRIASLIGPDHRWGRIATWSGNDDVDGIPGTVLLQDQRDLLYNRFVAMLPDVGWLPPRTVVSVSRWARFSRAMRVAMDAGLGWIIPIHREVLLVPMPTVRYAENSTDVLHCDTGRPAIEWSDGSGPHYLHGTEFSESLYHQIIEHRLRIRDIAALRNVDQRSIAMRYLTFDQLVRDSDAQLIDSGARGTQLYRVPLPPRLARDRRAGYGDCDYFIHMRDASHPEREFIEWVDPRVGRRGDAELCQAKAFGITLDQWLSIEQEG